MPVRRLSVALELLGQGQSQALRGNQTAGTVQNISGAPFVQPGECEQVLDDGSYSVFTDGVTRSCLAATDEPILAGMKVWVSKTTDDQWIIHGSIKG